MDSDQRGLLASRRALPLPGAVERDGTVTFTLYAPNKRSVHLVGDFNDWDRSADVMEQVAEGLWSTSKELPRGAFGYQFLIDGGLRICDPYARFIEDQPGDQPPRAVVRPGSDPYRWQHDDWSRPRFEDLVLYELHIADFTPQRDFREAVERLDYVRDLGVNCLELMPIFGVRKNTGWGYTPTHFFAPNDDYGGPDELRWLIDEAHGLGMGVVLDMVLAHTGEDHPFNRMYPYEQSPWYGEGPEGGNAFALPQLDYDQPATRRFVTDVLEYWLRDYHVDGFRFDYLSNIGTTQSGHGIPTLCSAARSVRPDAWLIGEHLPEDPVEMIAADMNGAWHVRFSYAIKALLCEGPIESYHPDRFEEAVRTLDPADQGYDEYPRCMVNYLESHDEERVVLEVVEAGFDEETARRKSALGATVLMTAVGEPMLYHGQAWGHAMPKNMDHNYIRWETLESPGGKGLRDHYAHLIRLRAEQEALRGASISLDAILPDQRCVVYRRWKEGASPVIVVVNFSGRTQALSVELPEGRWREHFTGDERDGGPGEIEIDRYAARIFLAG